MSSTLLSRATTARRRTLSGLLATALAAATLAVAPAASAAEPEPVTATGTASVATAGPTELTVDVDGSGYAVGGVGVYVGITTVGSFSPTDAGRYLGTVWTAFPGNPQFAVKADGALDVTLTLDAAAIATLDPAKRYAVYTFKAHGQAQSDPSQTVEMPLDLDFGALGLDPAVAAEPVAQSPAGLDVAVTGGGFPKVYHETESPGFYVYVRDAATGTMVGGRSEQLWLAAAGAPPYVTGEIDARGNLDAVLSLSPATVAGLDRTRRYELFVRPAHTATVTDRPTFTVPLDLDFMALQGKARLKSVAVAVTKAPTTVSPGRAVVTVASSVAGYVPSGRVTVTYTRSKVTRKVTATLAKGRAIVAVPALSSGTWRASVAYSGDADHAGGTASRTFVAKKAKVAKPVVRVTKRPTSRRAGTLTVTVRSATAGRPGGKVRVQLVKGRATKTYTVRLNSRGQATVRVGRLARGTWKAYALYFGDSRFDGRAKTYVGNVRVTR